MNRYLNNFLYRPDGIRINFLTHVFMYMTFGFGVGFVFFTGTESVQASALHDLTVDFVGVAPLITWGGCAMMVALVNLTATVLRIRWLAKPAAMAGFLLWTLTVLIYGQEGYWFQLAVGALPNMAFWAWYYVAVSSVIRNAPVVQR